MLTTWLTDPDLLMEYLEEQRLSRGREDTFTRLLLEEAALQARLQAEHRVQAIAVRKQAEGQLAECAADTMLADSSGRVGQIRAEMASIQRRLMTVRGEAAQHRSDGDDVGREVERTRQQLSALHPDGRRALVLNTLDHVAVFAGGNVTVALRAD